MEQLRAVDLSCVVCTAVRACSSQVSPRSSRLCRQCCGRNRAEPLSSELSDLCWSVALVCSHQTASAPAHLPMAAGSAVGGEGRGGDPGSLGSQSSLRVAGLWCSLEVPAWCSMVALGAELHLFDAGEPVEPLAEESMEMVVSSSRLFSFRVMRY